MNEAPKLTAEDRLPGDPTKEQLIDRIIRVDHAGEYGAKRIYEGQLAVTCTSRSCST
jgi:ubiquinone biosynthesis monooxygenase Coq7